MSLGYTKSLLVFFVIPFLFLFRTIVHSVRPKPFFAAVATVCALGWSWSIFLSYKKWWVFPEKDIVGLHILPHLPLEEFVIYPIGGAFSIFLYMLATRKNSKPEPVAYWMMLIATALAFTSIAFASGTRPFYLYSQLILYNGLCALLAPYTARSIRIAGLLFSVAVLGAIGFVWDYLAFKFDWWIYLAVTGIRVIRIPIEDINFYLMAPTAAISLYLALCRLFPREKSWSH